MPDTTSPPQFAAIYARVSSEEQSKNYSIPTQLEECRKWADDHNYVVVAEFFEDASGMTLDRPQFNALRDWLAAGNKVAVTITLDIDRLARRLVLQLIAIDEFEKAGAPIRFVNEPYEDTPEGRFMSQVRGAVAELEREKILERMNRGKRGRAKAGQVHVGRYAPYGYRYVSGPHTGSLEVVEDEAEIVRQVFRWYTVGDGDGRRMGTGEIARRLCELRVPTSSDLDTPGRPAEERCRWHPNRIGQMLHTETYAGAWHWNKVHRTPDGHQERRPRDQWIVITVPAIISLETLERARKVAKENTIMARRNTRHEYLMRGRLRCSVCGHTLYGHMRGGEHQQYYYRCLKSEPDFSANGHTTQCARLYRVDRVDAACWAAIVAVFEDEDALRGIVAAHRDRRGGSADDCEAQLSAVDRRLAAIGRQQARLLQTWLAHEISDDLYHATIAGLNADAEAQRRERARIERAMQEASSEQADIEAAVLMVHSLRAVIRHFTFDRRVELLDGLHATATITPVGKRINADIELTFWLGPLKVARKLLL